MSEKPTYEELEKRVKRLERETAKLKRVEKDLREGEAGYRLLFSAVPDASVIVDVDTGQIVDVNEAALALYGYSREEFLQLKALELSAEPEKSAKHIDEVASGVPALVSPGPVERLHKKKDGTIFSVEIPSGVCLLNGRRMICAIFRDISERRQREAALRESEERYRRIVETAQEGIWMIDGHGRILYVNPQMARMMGYNVDELLGGFLFDFISDLAPVDVSQGPGRGMQEPIQQHDFQFRRKDGSVLWAIVSTSPIFDDDGQFSGALGTTLNVTKRRQAEEALRQSEKKYSTLVENSLTGIYVDQDGKIVFANNRFAEIYRYPREKLPGLESWRLVHHGDRNFTREAGLRILRGEEARTEYEARGLTQDGEAIWVKKRNTRIDYGERPAILGNAVDITEQKVMEQNLRKLNDELKNFVDVVSHDLKNPIISILGFTSLLSRKCQEELGEAGRRYIKQINASARRMEAFVTDLLALSKTGEPLSGFCDIFSFETVGGVIEGLQDRLTAKGIEVVVRENLPVITCDRKRICQVFDNLITNAMKFVGHTERPRIEIGYGECEDFHRFYVRDNGIGIDPKNHRKVFEPFRRLKEIKDEEGTGLGLAIVERIVNKHGGRVWVESEKGKGATFYFSLPKAS